MTELNINVSKIMMDKTVTNIDVTYVRYWFYSDSDNFTKFWPATKFKWNLEFHSILDKVDQEHFWTLIPQYFMQYLYYQNRNVKIKIFQRYNLTHFHDRSGFFAMNELKTKFNIVADNYFEDHVVSNLDGKLRNRNIDANCFCRKVTEPLINNFGFVILIL